MQWRIQIMRGCIAVVAIMWFIFYSLQQFDKLSEIPKFHNTTGSMFKQTHYERNAYDAMPICSLQET